MQITLSKLKAEFQRKLKNPLPGVDAQLKMAPLDRNIPKLNTLIKKDIKHAAVLILFTERNQQPCFVLTKRITYLGVHSGQMSFPGGKKEKEDENYQATALRETHEEIGLQSNNVEVLGALTPLYIPPSNFYVEPFLAFLKTPQEFTPQPTEVDTIHYVPFNDFLQDRSETLKPFNRNGSQVNIPVFELNQQIVWGATAMILSELKALYSDT